MTDSEESRLLHFAELGVCPNCGEKIAKGTAVKRGNGSFCSLDCVASFFEAEFAERARRLAIAAKQ